MATFAPANVTCHVIPPDVIVETFGALLIGFLLLASRVLLLREIDMIVGRLFELKSDRATARAVRPARRDGSTGPVRWAADPFRPGVWKLSDRTVTGRFSRLTAVETTAVDRRRVFRRQAGKFPLRLTGRRRDGFARRTPVKHPPSTGEMRCGRSINYRCSPPKYSYLSCSARYGVYFQRKTRVNPTVSPWCCRHSGLHIFLAVSPPQYQILPSRSYLVAVILLVNCLHAGMNIHIIYRISITYYSQRLSFASQGWTMWAEPGVTTHHPSADTWPSDPNQPCLVVELYHRLSSRPENTDSLAEKDAKAKLIANEMFQYLSCTGAYQNWNDATRSGRDPIAVWTALDRDNCELPRFALTILQVVVNQAGCERAFSDVKNTESPRCSRLGLEKFEKMTKSYMLLIILKELYQRACNFHAREPHVPMTGVDLSLGMPEIQSRHEATSGKNFPLKVDRGRHVGTFKNPVHWSKARYMPPDVPPLRRNTALAISGCSVGRFLPSRGFGVRGFQVAVVQF
ncbi:hypothetical protein B0H10DRAFT_1948784 [Mycena sp. CBHHK59/15]|nr:hypothetical protein B0H10DRAFT_1948784 [Mycena sp. CBHHK59/15]